MTVNHKRYLGMLAWCSNVTAAWCVALLLAGCAPPPTYEQLPPEANLINVFQARQEVIAGLKTVLAKPVLPDDVYLNLKMHPESIRVSAERIDCEFEVWHSGFGQDPTPRTFTCDIDLKRNDNSFVVRKQESVGQYGLASTKGGRGNTNLFEWATLGEAQAFVGAVNRLSLSATYNVASVEQAFSQVWWRDFQQKAAAWRALAVKPAMSEAVREHGLLAASAFSEKDLDRTGLEYAAGLMIDPVWPEGHFNYATLCAELRYYYDAIIEMQKYLELVPDAPDAQQAHDQVVIWKSKLPKT